MSWELHYTSVPRGLEPGAKGFCVVAASPNLPGPLRERLEGLSGYQQVFPAHDPRALWNPVVLAHHRLNLGGRPLSLLSRVSFAGLDYTDRSNKYAHHVVIEPSERPAGGPAWLLGRPGFLERAWSGEPRVLPPRRAIPQGDPGPAIASAWRSATGDAGWAGALAEAFLSNPGRPSYLIYEPGFDPLPLFAEALAILPASRRWDVDFNTYFTVAPQGLTCAWRGVLAGTPAAAQALKTPGALVLDLTRPLDSPADGPLVHQARTGEPPAAPSPSRSSPKASRTLATPAARIADDPAPEHQLDDDIPVLDLAEVPPPTPSPWRGIQTTDRTRARTPAPSRSRFHAARWGFASAMLLLLMLVAGAAYLHFVGNPEFDALIVDQEKQIQKAQAQNNPPANAEPEAAPEQPKLAKKTEPAPEAGEPKPDDPASPPTPEPQPVVADDPGPEIEKPEQKEPAPLPTPGFVHQPLFLDLPELPVASGLRDGADSKPALLDGPRGKVSKITLHQLSVGQKIAADKRLKVRDPDSTGDVATWRIGPDDDGRGLTYTTFDIAEVETKPEGLVFTWVDKSASNVNFVNLAEALRDSVLELTIGEPESAAERVFVVLRKLKPLAKPIELSSPQTPNRYDNALPALWATGRNLGASTWRLEARRFQIDAIDSEGQPQRLQGENRSKKPQPEFAIVPEAVYLEVGSSDPVARAPKTDEHALREGNLAITLKSRNRRTDEEEDWRKMESRLENNKAELAALREKNGNKKNTKRIGELEEAIKSDEAKRKELEPNHRIYALMENNQGVRLSLSLILGLRLADGTFLDLARIGEFPEGPKEP